MEVSIPEGSIDSSEDVGRLDLHFVFQFPKVRLIGVRWQSLALSVPVSIPEGSIDRSDVGCA